jgi:hypothetical protein
VYDTMLDQAMSVVKFRYLSITTHHKIRTSISVEFVTINHHRQHQIVNTVISSNAVMTETSQNNQGITAPRGK